MRLLRSRLLSRRRSTAWRGIPRYVILLSATGKRALKPEFWSRHGSDRTGMAEPTWPDGGLVGELERLLQSPETTREMREAPTVSKDKLQGWVVEALEELGGHGTALEVSRVIWKRHEADLRQSGDLFFTWQYDIRWAAQKLRGSGRLAPSPKGSQRPWTLVAK